MAHGRTPPAPSLLSLSTRDPDSFSGIYTAVSGEGLAGRRRRIDQLGAGAAPDPADAAACADKDRRRCQCYEGHQKRVFDQILTLLVREKAFEQIHMGSLRRKASKI